MWGLAPCLAALPPNPRFLPQRAPFGRQIWTLPCPHMCSQQITTDDVATLKLQCHHCHPDTLPTVPPRRDSRVNLERKRSTHMWSRSAHAQSNNALAVISTLMNSVQQCMRNAMAMLEQFLQQTISKNKQGEYAKQQDNSIQYNDVKSWL